MSISLAALADRGIERFGRLRVWGSVGFLLTAVGAPLVLDWLQEVRGWRAVAGGPSEPGLEIAFLGFGVLVAAAGIAALCIPGGRALSLRAHKGEWRSLVGNGPYLRVLLVCLVAFSLMESPMFQFPVFVRAHGGDMGTVSRMWILMTLVEIPLFLISGAGLRRLGPRGLLAIGIAAAGVRWTLCGFTDDLRLIYAAQLLHGVTVTGFLGANFYIDGVVSERLRSTGQTLVATLGVSVGGILSNLVGGWLADHVSGNAPYRIAGTGALLLAAALPFLLPRTPHRSFGAAPAESREVMGAVHAGALSPEA
jgi:PPP family 3-phenylpropionic acid transporter